jgi:Zn-dependent peptidase ImmA (M78 family)
MKSGTPGFMGHRLTELREARGLTATALSEISGLSRQTLHAYENGVHTPQPDTLADLASKLNVPEEFFFRNFPNLAAQNVFYRSRSATTKAERTRGERHLAWLGRIVDTFREHLELPEPNLPALEFPEDPLAIPPETVEKLAIQCRRHWGLGDLPISDVVLLMENNGIVVTRSMLEAPTLDAFSCFAADGTPLMFLTSDKSSAVRSRFDAAHELGHLILHGSLSREEFFHPQKHREYERQADLFGAAFLIPAETFAADLTVISLPALRALKPKWKVSMGAMLVRCQTLGLIDEDQARRLWITFTRLGYRKREPLDDQIPVEQPRLLRRCVALLQETGTLSKFDILSALALSAADVEALCCLPTGYFKDGGTLYQLPEPKLRRFGKSDAATAPKPAGTGAENNIVPHPALGKNKPKQ